MEKIVRDSVDSMYYDLSFALYFNFASSPNERCACNDFVLHIGSAVLYVCSVTLTVQLELSTVVELKLACMHGINSST